MKVRPKCNGMKHGRPDFNMEHGSKNKIEVGGGTRSRGSEIGLTKE